MRTRLIFTANDRHGYFQQVMTSWNNVRGFTNWRPVVYLEPSDHQIAMAQTATHVGAEVRLNRQRLGVLSNPWHALNNAFTTGNDFVVLAEDDVLVSTDTLEYFTWASKHLHDNNHVLAVCANSMEPYCHPADTQTIVKSSVFSPLVWGTWSNRWTAVLRDTWDHDYSTGTPTQPQSGWDWNINLRILNDHRHVVKPLASRSTHIGKLNGTHTTPWSFPGSVSTTFRPDRPAEFYHLTPR